MITFAQIAAESQSPALTDEQTLVLQMLVKQFPPYINAVGLWPALADVLAEEVATPTVKTQALKAVLTALGDIPAIVVESQGRAEAPSFFSTKSNWYALAQDVLNILYDLPINLGSQSFALTQKHIQDMVIKDDLIIVEDDSGRRY